MGEFEGDLMRKLGKMEGNGDALEEQNSLRHGRKKTDIGNCTWALQPSCCWRSGVEWLLV